MPAEILSRSEEQTAALAASLARLLAAGDVVFLTGPLGAGKTFFIRAACRELGVTEPVTSPSFTMAQTYAGTVPVHHLDLYRLAGFGSADAVDFEPFFEEDAITFVEWPQQAEAYIARPGLRIELEHVDEHSRRLRLTALTPGMASRLESFDADAGH